MSLKVIIDNKEAITMHEPYRSKPFTIGQIIAENLNLRQKLNKQEKSYERKLLRAEQNKENALKESKSTKEDYNILLEDYIKLKHKLKDLEGTK